MADAPMTRQPEPTDGQFPDEVAHLADVHRLLDDALTAAEARFRRLDDEYLSMKRYMVEYRGETDPHEMLQNELGLNRIDATVGFADSVRQRIATLQDSPYFARMDFRDAAGARSVTYLGRFAFSHDGELLVSDWRSPIASLFYDFELGPASYVAPAGTFEGELVRKRQFRIKDGRLEYAIESSASVHDDVLQRELGRASSEKMKSVIATIQAEQNRVIRDERPGTLVIQGVAGSGKTSVALHRVAFLLYRFRDRLAASQVTILSPNDVFADYISTVLPELGEEPIRELTAADIAAAHLPRNLRFEADKDPLGEVDEGWAARTRFKSTYAFVGLLDEFIAQLPALAFAPAACSFGRFSVTAEQVSSLFEALGRQPVKRRLPLMADALLDRFDSQNHRGDRLPTRGAIVGALKRMLTVKDTLALYRRFYEERGLTAMLSLPTTRTLEWADVYPFLYLQAAFEGLTGEDDVLHLVVDEMQDYTPIQHAVFNRLFRHDKTILGDFSQKLHPYQDHGLDDLLRVYDGAEHVELRTSYRSTYEIMTFAQRIRGGEPIEVIERHGPEPVVVSCVDDRDELAQIVRRLRAFAASGFSSLGVVTKTHAQARQLYDALSPDHDVHLIASDSSRFASGVSLTSIQMAKGLEFDEVIIPDVAATAYHTEHDRSLLFVACTRAMHRLTLLHSGERSPLLPTRG